jgi:Protein of unknown function (DUF4197)
VTRHRWFAWVVLVTAATAWPATAEAQFDDILKHLPNVGVRPQPGNPSTVRIGSALKEALQVATDNAVRLTGRDDGYLADATIKILLPEQVRKLEPGLRTIGFGPQVDDLVVGMNRAAEQAAPSAKKLFWDAIGDMAIDDGGRILDGGATAATDYFQAKANERLAVLFRPIVEERLSQVGVVRQYRDLTTAARSLPFVKVEPLDLGQYVVGKALDGLFHVVGEEERKIRTNPAARVTDLLKQVFGSAR